MKSQRPSVSDDEATCEVFMTAKQKFPSLYACTEDNSFEPQIKRCLALSRNRHACLSPYYLAFLLFGLP
jgi:hypothetical protein